jgi:hypothetical protein
MSSDLLVTYFFTFISWTFYCKLTAVYFWMELLTSDRTLFNIVAESSSMYHFEICVLGHIVGGYNCSIVVD